MSVLSKFLKDKLNVKEVNFESSDVFMLFKAEIIKKGGSALFKNASTKDLSLVCDFINAEIYRRNVSNFPTAGIGIANEPVRTTLIDDTTKNQK